MHTDNDHLMANWYNQKTTFHRYCCMPIHKIYRWQRNPRSIGKPQFKERSSLSQIGAFFETLASVYYPSR